MKNILILAVVFTNLSIVNIVMAQPTGDFVIGFPSPDTLLTNDSLFIQFHVPDSYQPGIASKLIVGIHGIGDPSTSELIRNYLAPTGDSLGAIIACPDPYLQDQPRSKLVVNIAIDSIMKWYSIDTAEMYIGGYSAGSDVAAQYLLDNPVYKMKGLIWFAPGFFFKPNLSMQTNFPLTCLCHGDEDRISTALGQVEAIKDSFDNSGFPYFFNSIPGIEHTMNFPTFTKEILECMRYINDPLTFVADSVIPTSIKEYSLDDQLRILPNPSNGVFTIQLSEPLDEFAEIIIYEITGRIVYNTTLYSGTENHSVDLSHLSSGLYEVVVYHNSGSFKKLALKR